MIGRGVCELCLSLLDVRLADEGLQVVGNLGTMLSSSGPEGRRYRGQ